MMEQNSRIRKIDRITLASELKELSNQYLTEIDETYITLFANKAKILVDNVFDDFIISQEHLYTDKPEHGKPDYSIKDKQILLKFTDIQEGYRRKMQNWVKEHPVEVKKQQISVHDLPKDIPILEREALKRSMSALGIGTIVVVGLRFLTGSNWLYFGELVVMALSAQQYKKGTKADDECLKKKQKDLLDQKKNIIVSDIICELYKWINAAEEESERVIKEFNI